MSYGDSQQTFRLQTRQRAIAQRALHEFFAQRDFLPVDAPILVKAPGTEVHLQYFKAGWIDHQGKDHSFYLRSSPELHLKQALGEGLERIYHLGKAFRNAGEFSEWHHPEFTMLEWYQTGIGFEAFMDQSFELITSIHAALTQAFPDLTRPALVAPRKISVFDAFSEFAKIDLIDNDPDLNQKARSRSYHSIREDDSFETSYFKILIDIIEPELAKLGNVFLYDYPPSQAALARVRNGKAKRFELYLDGIEICNAFEELTDADENMQRLVSSNQQRAQLGYEIIPNDEGFLAALHKGLPACCGNALGFDRVLAYLLKKDSIVDVIPFRERWLPK